MKAAFIADIHAHNYALGNDPAASRGKYRNSRLAAITATLGRVMDLPVSAVFVLGDLFDVHSPGPQVIDEVGDVFHRARGKRIYLLRGNHDARTTASGDNALAPLRFIHNVEVIEEPTIVTLGDGGELSVFAIPHPWTVRDAAPPGKADVAVGHFGLWHDGHMRFHGSIPEAEVLSWCEIFGVRYFLAGDWHHHRVGVDGRVIQVGTLCPKNFADADLTVGHVAIWDDGGVSFVEVPGPRFTYASTTQAAIDAASRLMEGGNWPFVGLPPGVDLPKLDGAVFHTHHRQVATRAVNRAADAQRLAPSIVDPMAVLRAFLDQRHPEDADKLFTEISQACKPQRADAITQ